MNSNFIRLWDILEIMDALDGQGKPFRFQMKYITANRLQGTGGEIIELKDACKCSGKTKQGKPIFSTKKNFPANDRTSTLVKLIPIMLPTRNYKEPKFYF